MIGSNGILLQRPVLWVQSEARLFMSVQRYSVFVDPKIEPMNAETHPDPELPYFEADQRLLTFEIFGILFECVKE